MRKHKNDDTTWDVAGRIKALEQFTGPLVGPRVVSDAMPADEAAPTRVPSPRASRIFLRGAEGFGAYADLTVTAPQPRTALD